MAFPTPNAQQETRKILEEIQLKKQLLQKGGPVASLPNIPQGNISLGATQFMPSAHPQQSGVIANDIPLNSTARASWNQANSQSFGFFVPQDSLSGNNILPVLPRFDSVTK